MNAPMHALVEWLGPVKDSLIDIGAELERRSAHELGDILGDVDRKLRDAYLVAERCRRLLAIHKAPDLTDYNPVEILRQHSGELGVTLATPGSVKAVRMVHGDPDAVLESVRLFRDNITLGAGGSIHTEIAAGEGVPRVAVRLEGEGRIPEALRFDRVYPLDLDTWGNLWKAATNGGHIGLNEEGAVFYLSGDRQVPPSLEGLSGPCLAMRRLARRLQSWRGAAGHHEPGLISDDEAQFVYRDTVQAALRYIDEAAGPHLRRAPLAG